MKNNQHQRSVETLSLSGNGDEAIIKEILNLLNNHSPGQPYTHNALIRIKWLLDDYLVEDRMDNPNSNFVKCPVCYIQINTGYRKQHLKRVHGWHYTDESPNEPIPPQNK